MRCETCHGQLMTGIPCPDCGGSGVAHCCDGICAQPETAGAYNSLPARVAVIEDCFKVVRWAGSRPAHLAPTGEPYVVITSDLQNATGSADEAIASWQAAIEAYIHEKQGHNWKIETGRLYWRIEPELEEVRGRWKVYSRLLISCAPVVKR